MGDHFVLLVDRLLTESTLEAAIERSNLSKQLTALATDDIKIDCPSHVSVLRNCPSSGKIVECRICQDEDEDSNMETPCSCCGSLKYAHRSCIQRWCNEKGDTVCEICQQPYKPGYTAPPPMFQLGGIPMNFRGNWHIVRRDVNDPRFISMVSTERNLLEPDYDDYTASTSRSLVCFRIVAVIFMVLLILRHTFPIIVSGTQNYSLPLILLLLLRTSEIILPFYVIVRAVNAAYCRRRQQQQESPDISDSSSDEETGGLPTLQQQPQAVHVH
ncbi:putative E3 ubiquitin ligase SUD1 [Camellia lanceoleosa]|uniref:E3 ubiquitin ligase SUD1 n=1 Tax=Camellia lanceoleosa TaxID=1840588 RepID=A0ACC0GAS4_9ERIC|nr:putative E3 ubiquitin ligase SUD1 [Camellia lanceoleosa]